MYIYNAIFAYIAVYTAYAHTAFHVISNIYKKTM